ncbi:hypothetical protein AMR41_08195 [Hapalosiphon sp. MRB220]|nr:hypothetical protein AMR41_08195 [Hapalosiphon sp. MRB220]
MRKSYYKDGKGLALPNKITFQAIMKDDIDVDQNQVNSFVDKLKRPGWYYDNNGDKDKDTRATLLEHKEIRTTKDPFTNRLVQFWLCESCNNGVTYSGIDLGHKTNWKDELKKAGVETPSEAKAVYNNLLNLKIECATCNRSHDWEQAGDGYYKD